MLTCQLSCKCINQINTLNFPFSSWESPIASLVAQRVKCLPAMWETRVRSLGQEDPLEEEMATLSSILAWEIPQTEEAGGLQPKGSQRAKSRT